MPGMTTEGLTPDAIDDLARRARDGDRETIERDHPQLVEPLLLRDVYGMSYEEIAQQVGAPLGTIKAQIHTGRKLARPLLRGTP